MPETPVGFVLEVLSWMSHDASPASPLLPQRNRSFSPHDEAAERAWQDLTLGIGDLGAPKRLINAGIILGHLT